MDTESLKKLNELELDEIDRGTTPPNSPRDTGYNLRSHVIDIE